MTSLLQVSCRMPTLQQDSSSPSGRVSSKQLEGRRSTEEAGVQLAVMEITRDTINRPTSRTIEIRNNKRTHGLDGIKKGGTKGVLVARNNTTHQERVNQGGLGYYLHKVSNGDYEDHCGAGGVD